MRFVIAGAALAACSFAAQAGPAFFDAYYQWNQTELKESGARIDGDGGGFGVRGQGRLTDTLFLTGLYQSSDAEVQESGETVFDFDIREARVGLSYQTRASRRSPWTLGVDVEAVSLKLEDDHLGAVLSDDGAAAFIGAAVAPSRGTSLFGRVGYVQLGESDGFEGEVGLSARVSDQVHLFVDYRISRLGFDGDFDLNIDVARVGLRFMFGNGF